MHSLLFDVEEFPHNTPGPTGTNGDLGALVAKAKPEVAEEDKNDLRLLQDVYGVVSKKEKPYKTEDKNGKWHNDVEAYIKDRDAFFGSAEKYSLYKKKALEELEADNRKLRNVIEPNKKVRKKKKDWADAQTVFYCWVRKAYEEVLKDDIVDIPKLIKSGTSKKLNDALQKVRVDYGHGFQAGGFNPRPMKIGGRYRLGTLSDHTLGTAIDIESK